MRALHFSPLLLMLASATGLAATNSAGSLRTTEFHQLNPFAHERLLGEVTSFSIEGISIAKANLTVTTTTDLNCGTSESGYQGCTENDYTSELAVEVRVLLTSPTTSSDQPSSEQWRVYFPLSQFTQDQLKAIQENNRFFDPFGSATVRSRELARSLFSLSLGKTTLRWNQSVFGNVCTSSSSAGEHIDTQCNVVGQSARSRVAATLRISRK